MYNYSSSPELTNVTISGNTARTGGGMHNYSSSPVLNNVMINGNTAAILGGGGMYNTSSSPVLKNVIISGNSANDKGGGIYNSLGGYGSYTNITLVGNTANSGGGGVYTSGGWIPFYNSIIKDAIEGGNYEAHYSIFPNGSGDNLNANSYTLTDIFNNPSVQDYTLKSTSPAINAGSNTYYTNNGGDLQNDKDLAGHTRLIGTNVDLGAYEYSSIYPTSENIVFVDSSVSVSGDGSSWATAVKELADALKWANDNKSTWGSTSDSLRIYVAKGTYLPQYSPEDGVNYGTNQGRDNTFLMVKDVQVFGGFPSGGSTLANRNWVDNPTILSGDVNNDDVVSGSGATLSITGNSDNAYHVVVSAGAVGKALLDGFTIHGGNANGGSSPKINGLSIQSYYGGGMLNSSSSPMLNNVTINGNTAANLGGGMYNWTSSPILSDVTISGNAADNGGGMSNTGSFPILTNVTIIGNSANNNGGGMSNRDLSFPILTNVTISGNSANNKGGGIANVAVFGHPSLNIYNSIIWGNTASGGNNNIYRNVLTSPPTPTPKFYNSLIEGSGGSASWVSSFGIDSGNNIDVNPQFVNQGSGDYSLQATSPAINAGNNTYYTDAGGDLQIDKDLAGNPRVYDYDISGIIDMGAYEYQCTKLPVILNQPVGQVVCTGNQTMLSVDVEGTGLSYQWQEDSGSGFVDLVNSEIYSNVNSPDLTLSNLTYNHHNNKYRCVISNSCDIIISNEALIQVDPTVTIMGQPINRTVCQESNVSFTVNAINTQGQPLTYQWQRSTNGGKTYTNITDNGIFSGTNTRTLTLTNIPANYNQSKFRCVLNGYCQSWGAILTVTPIATVTSSPASVKICEGNNASFTVNASGVGLSYRWQVNTGSGFQDIYDGGIYGGAATSTLNLNYPGVETNGYQYRCRVWGNSDCDTHEDTSGVATLSVAVSAEANSIYWNSPITTDQGISQAVSYILGTNKIQQPGGKATYQAGQAILLEPGFEVEAGAVFEAKIKNACESSGGNSQASIPANVNK